MISSLEKVVGLKSNVLLENTAEGPKMPEHIGHGS